MKILILNQFFYPDVSATAQIATDLAEDLAATGTEVTSLAARGAYLGRITLPSFEVHRGVRIVRAPCSSFGRGNISGRLADYGSFYFSAAVRLALRERPDVVIVMSTPPLVGSLGLALRLKGARFVYWVQDLYPELAVEFGVLRASSPTTRALDVLSRAILRHAEAVVVLGGAMSERVTAKGVARERIHVIPNWADGRSIRPVPHEENPFRREHGLDGKTVFLYSGNMGRGHDLSTLLAAARAMRDEAVFMFIGDGAKRSEVESASHECSFIRLVPYQPRDRLAHSLSAGDVHLIAQDASTLGLMEPSKLYGILAAGRPVLYVGPAASEIACTVERERVGRVVANRDVAGVVRALRELAANRETLGMRARAAFDAGYDRPHRTAQFMRILRGIFDQSDGRRRSRTNSQRRGTGVPSALHAAR